MSDRVLTYNTDVPDVRLAATRPLRVVMVTARFFPSVGGVQTHVYEVARRMASRGVDINVLTTDPARELPPYEEVEGVKVKRVRAWPEHRDYFLAPGIYDEVRKGHWDLVHIQGIHTLVPPLAILASLQAGIPYLLTFHTGGHSSRLRNLIRTSQWKALRPLLARAGCLVGVSRFEANFFQQQLGLPPDRFVVIPNGAQLSDVNSRLDQFRPFQSDARSPVILSLGRLERYKGHHRVLAALPLVKAHHPGVRLQIIGVGPEESSLRKMAEELGVSSSVEIKSIASADRSGMADILSKAALVVLLSEYEAHPISVMEALAMRRPVLVAETSGLQEFVDTGFARGVSIDSTAQVVANAIHEQLVHPLIPDRFELPSWDTSTDQILELYKTLIRRPICVS